MQPVIIIGSGLAGYTLAREIRKLDKTLPVQIITADDGDFYSKPMLSNALSKNQSIEKLIMNSADVMAEQQTIEILKNTRVTQIDKQSNKVITNKGEHPYSNLVIASGANPVRLPIAGNAANNILSVNSLDDYAVFRTQLQGKKRITILGAGLIGCEFANDLAATGYQVNIVDLADRPLGRLLPELAADYLKQALSKLDINWHLQKSITSMDKTATGYVLTLSDGSTLDSELVLSAIGLRSSTQLAIDTGIEVNRGIVTDQYLQTSTENIYALGDCAEINGSVLPFVMPIMLGSKALATTLTGDKTKINYPAMPVAVKTPAHAVVVCPPPLNSQGQWQEEIIGNGIKACYYENNVLTGFALTGDAVKEKQALLKLMTGS